MLTVMQDLSSEVALKSLGEGDRPISPAALAGLLSTLLYARRSSPFFVEPIVAGLDSRGKPYLCGQVFDLWPAMVWICICLNAGCDSCPGCVNTGTWEAGLGQQRKLSGRVHYLVAVMMECRRDGSRLPLF